MLFVQRIVIHRVNPDIHGTYTTFSFIRFRRASRLEWSQPRLASFPNLPTERLLLRGIHEIQRNVKHFFKLTQIRRWRYYQVIFPFWGSCYRNTHLPRQFTLTHFCFHSIILESFTKCDELKIIVNNYPFISFRIFDAFSGPNKYRLYHIIWLMQPLIKKTTKKNFICPLKQPALIFYNISQIVHNYFGVTKVKGKLNKS